MGYFKILVFPFHDVGSLAICTNAIPISGASIWNLSSAFRFYKLDGDCGGTYSISRTQHSPVFRRLACPSSFAGVSPVQPFTSLGNHYKSGSNTKSSEIRPSSISGLRVCRFEVPDSHWHCQSSRRESQQNSCPSISGSTGSIHYRPRIFVHFGIPQCSSRFSSVGSPLYETSSVPSSGHLETSPPQLGPTYSNIPFMSCSNQMVDESFHLCGWNSPCYTSPRFSCFQMPAIMAGAHIWNP